MNRRQKEKRKKMINKKLIKLYPFLLPRNCFSDKVDKHYDYSYTELEQLPKGWKKAFGLLICEDIKKELVKANMLNTYRIMQIKEKYGTLRWYDNGATEEIHKIIRKYEHISAFTCVSCGKVNVPIYDDGWVSPFCDNCYKNLYNRRKYKTTKNPLDFKVCEPKLTSTFEIKTYYNGETHYELYDISDILVRMNVDISKLPKYERNEEIE